MYNYAPDLIKNLGYAHLFEPKAMSPISDPLNLSWIDAFNAKSLKFS